MFKHGEESEFSYHELSYSEKFLEEAKDFEFPVFFPEKKGNITVYRGTKWSRSNSLLAEGVYYYSSLEDALSKLLGSREKIEWEKVLQETSKCISGQYGSDVLFIPTTKSLEVAKRWQGSGDVIKATVPRSCVIDAQEDLEKGLGKLVHKGVG
ncbi:MAG: hypothetical protein FJ044_00670 [Candidatus Cloacimonetes bacterium]|nr:hypothetical protein [Candidatus Cloacimonadota bacterium]